jgi:hypothetical protein
MTEIKVTSGSESFNSKIILKIEKKTMLGGCNNKKIG